MRHGSFCVLNRRGKKAINRKPGRKAALKDKQPIRGYLAAQEAVRFLSTHQPRSPETYLHKNI